ncbi:polar amino acid transport system substrate-binding protein [Desulfobaculum xiamenense]|uniref:Polar amino acid transport system substrate-binding protein n=1 Tax=Desulfobaculum xiamenense TaxID=995050 RepID=A0A846QK96_9BACT|nr:transporter substrate-binding domain-containing protein [Desulfobaculum xiamenense]NJB67480.1 polar amino acid transport system substrate-binding protein [Desulfobaculum xiamenense]
MSTQPPLTSKHIAAPPALRVQLLVLTLLAALICAVPAQATARLNVVYTESAPWSMSVNATPSGIAVDILREAAKRAGIGLDFVSTPPRQRLRMLDSGKADLAIETFTDKGLERHADMLTPPYLTRRIFVIYSLAERTGDYPRYEKLRWHQVAVVRNRTYFDPFYTDRTISKTSCPTLGDAFARLLRHGVHAVATEECEGGYWLATHQNLARDIARTGISYNEYRPVHFALSRKSKNADAAQALGPALISMIQDGTIADIRARYLMGY